MYKRHRSWTIASHSSFIIHGIVCDDDDGGECMSLALCFCECFVRFSTSTKVMGWAASTHSRFSESILFALKLRRVFFFSPVRTQFSHFFHFCIPMSPWQKLKWHVYFVWSSPLASMMTSTMNCEPLKQNNKHLKNISEWTTRSEIDWESTHTATH